MPSRAATSLADDVLEERLQSLANDMRGARDLVLELVPDSEDQQTWDEFRCEHQLKPDWAGAWQLIYTLLSDGRRADARSARRRSEARRTAGFPGMSDALASLSTSMQHPVIPYTRVARDRSEENRLVRLRDEAIARNAAVSAEIELAERHLQDSRQPEGFRLALWVLTYLAAVGIGLPVVAMANGPTELPVWGRTVIVGAFFSGLLLLLRFLFVYAAYLDESRRRERLPGSVWGLLMR